MNHPIHAMLIILAATCFEAEAKKSPANGSRDNIIEQIEKHAAALNTVTLDGYLKFMSVNKTSESQVAYLVTYETNMKSMLTLEGAGSYEYNAKITKEWAKYFCTPKMKVLAKNLNIAMLAGALIDHKGKRHSSTACY